MYIGLTRRAGAPAPRAAGRTTTSCSRPRSSEKLSRRGHGVGPVNRRGRPPDGRGRLARHRLAQGVRRAGPLADRAVHLLRRVDARRRAGADAHDQHRRPDDHELRHRRAEGRSSCPKILARRDPLLHRLLRARRRHRPRRRSRRRPYATATSTSSTARRCSRASPTDADYSGSRCRTDPKRRSTRASRCSSSRWTRRASRSCPIHAAWASTTSTRSSTRTSASRRRPSSARRTTAGSSSPTSSTTSGSRCARRASSSASLDDVRRVGAGHQAAPTAAASSTRSGCRSTSPGSTPGLEFLRLINWKVAWAATQGALRRRPTRRRSRCSAPSSTSRRSGCSWRSSASARYLKRRLARRRCSRPGSSSYYRGLIILTFGGGTNEVQRDLIAVFGLGMPMAQR